MATAAPGKSKMEQNKAGPGLQRPRILVLDDAGYRFRHQPQKDCWLLPRIKSAA